MPDRNMVIESIENCLNEKECEDCPYEGCIHAHGNCIGDLMAHALELLKNETASPTYFRLMAIKDELETENKTLKADVKELRRLTGSLTNLCENLLLKEQSGHKHGHWQNDKYGNMLCSVCGGLAVETMTGCLVDRHLAPYLSNYCPTCGAVMDEEVKQA